MNGNKVHIRETQGANKAKKRHGGRGAVIFGRFSVKHDVTKKNVFPKDSPRSNIRGDDVELAR